MSARKLSAKRLKTRTWIEIDSARARYNYQFFRKLIGSRVKLWAVVKSNAYGHGLFLFSKLLNSFGVDGFCVDSLIEGVRLREEGISKPILVLGPTLPDLFSEAAKHRITLTVSTLEGLRALTKTARPPAFHLKIDTGMHRQGFLLKDLRSAIAFLKKNRRKLGPKLEGVYTHFAAATPAGRDYTRAQFDHFTRAVLMFEAAGFNGLLKHCAATGGTLLDREYHLDAVRVGKGLYGFFPSQDFSRVMLEYLKPVLTWKTYIAELKNLNPGEAVGYDLTEQVRRPTRLAVLPVGYWHGLARALSSVGEVLVGGRRAKILGRVSMDLTTIDVTGIKCKPGDVVTLVGQDGKAELDAWEIARRAHTIPYEFLTRLNPLIEKRLR